MASQWANSNLKRSSGAMPRGLLMLSLYIAATNARNNESPTLHVVAPVHAAITNASIEVMLNCFLAQTSRDWALTVVGDGYDARAAAVVGRYTDPRINYAATDRAYGDHGHTPRELGLGLGESPWTVLTGVDNYYVPLFVETVVEKIRANPNAGLVYYDFLLDMKGELAAGAAYDAALRAYGDAPAEEDPEAVVVRPLLDGRVAEIRFRRGDDVAAVARDFVAAEGLNSGGGCDDAACVADLLAGHMASEAARPPGSGGAIGGGRPRALPPYSGHIDATLDESGRLDVGAVAVRTDVARRVGFGWRHHAADFSYVRAVLEELARVGLEALKLPQTLYVHN
ncbi:unnamed protein product [Pelagomonas calceolata]|uniref:Glycosyltransferase 2-like domain-containing protein n=1 Tax=Pelagomonas calceolata TaxID=35677 RepID=A0A7S3ZJR1_9STRA|nr:unnamed protein product [Pelagomonas calceolata]